MGLSTPCHVETLQLDTPLAVSGTWRHPSRTTELPYNSTYEPRHDETNVMHLRPAWIQTSLRIRTVWSGSMLFDISFCTCHHLLRFRRLGTGRGDWAQDGRPLSPPILAGAVFLAVPQYHLMLTNYRVLFQLCSFRIIESNNFNVTLC
jgi:hypothetical protein